MLFTTLNHKTSTAVPLDLQTLRSGTTPTHLPRVPSDFWGFCLRHKSPRNIIYGYFHLKFITEKPYDINKQVCRTTGNLSWSPDPVFHIGRGQSPVSHKLVMFYCFTLFSSREEKLVAEHLVSFVFLFI